MDIFLGTITNLSLVMCAAVALAAGIYFYVSEKNIGYIRTYILLIAIFTFIELLFHSLMGSTQNFELAYIFRNIAMVGIIGFLTVESVFINRLTYSNKKKTELINSFTFFFSLINYIFITRKNTIEFTVSYGRTGYYAIPSLGRSLHTCFIAYVVLLMGISAILWYRNSKEKRIKHIIKSMYMANLLLLAFTIPDTFLPQLGYASFPSSDYGAFICFCVILVATVKYNAFNLTEVNLGGYIYHSAVSNLLVFEMDGKIALINDTAKNFLGENAKVGQYMHDVFDISPLDEKSIINEVTSKGVVADYRCNLKNNTSCTMFLSEVRDYYNQSYCIIAYVIDRTHEEELIYEAQKADEAKSTFLAHMSHEIRTPINAIIGMNEMILRTSKSEDITSYSLDIQNASQLLLSLVNDILDFSKIEAGKMNLVPGNYSIISILNDSYNMISSRAKEKKLQLQITNNPKIPAGLYGDDLRIRQIVTNLLTNAVKYTDEGQVLCDMDFERTGVDSINLIIKVKDTGIGLSQEQIEHIFDSFKRVNEKRNQSIEGTGLGLAITQNLIKLMDGTIDVKSELSKGSEFIVILPQKVVDWTESGIVSEHFNDLKKDEAVHTTSFTAPNATILAVDDVNMNLKVLANLLKNTKINIHTASSGKKCLEDVCMNHYDLIFLDHMMPEMDGVETFEKMKQMEHLNKDTPVIVLTANAINGVREDYINLGFSDYLSKPVVYTELEEMLLKYLPKDLIIRENDELKGISLLEHMFPGINIQKALLYCGGSEEILLDVVNDYLDTVNSDELKKAYDEKNLDLYRQCAHSIKSNSMTIGLLDFAERAKALEFAAKDNDYGYITEKHQDFLKDYLEIVDKVKEFIIRNK